MITTKMLFGAATYTGTDGNDVLVGGARADLFIGSQGSDTLDGGGSYDTVSYENSPFVINNVPDSVVIPEWFPGVIVDLDVGIATKNVFTYNQLSDGTIEVVHEIFTDRLFSIENATGGAGMDTLRGSNGTNVLSGLGGEDTIDGRQGKDTILGGEGRDSLFGGDGGDVLFGGADNDFLVGGAGADRIDGGTNGIEISVSLTLPFDIPQPNIGALQGDVVSYGLSLSGVNIDLTKKGPQIGGDAQGDELINVESVSGSSFDDIIRVNGGYAFGSLGNDTLHGNAASDALIGGQGGDRLFGGAGDDLLAGNDHGPFGFLGNLDATPDELYGGEGNDLLIGGAGGDLLNGGNGHDLYYMVDAGDLIVDSGGIDTVVTTLASYTLGNDLENLIFMDEGETAENRTGYGNANDNLIVGGFANDTLYAGTGSDTLDGRSGDDVLGELWGNDTIVISDGTDLAIDFGATGGAEQDIIDLSSWGYGSLQGFYDQGGTIIQVGMDTQIQLYDGGPTLILQGVSAGNIDESDFYFG